MKKANNFFRTIIVILVILTIVTKGGTFPLLIFAVIASIMFKNERIAAKMMENFSQWRQGFSSSSGGLSGNFGASGFKEKIIDLNKINFQKNMKKRIFWGGGVILLLWLFFSSIVIVDAGKTGVYSLFGKVKDEELRSGFHLVIPLAKVTKMSIQTEEYTMSIVQGEGQKAGSDAIQALTKEGLSVDLDITVLYRLREDKASEIYRTVGLNYAEKIIRPSIRATIREVIANYEAKDIYSSKREEAAMQIAQRLQVNNDERGIEVEDILLRNVQLPANLAKSIQEKLQAEQEAQKYDFILEKERKEKERKVIEAEGQRDAQTIINESLSSNYLYYLYISDLKSREGTIYVPTNPSTGMPLFRELGQ